MPRLLPERGPQRIFAASDSAGAAGSGQRDPPGRGFVFFTQAAYPSPPRWCSGSVSPASSRSRQRGAGHGQLAP